MSTFQSAKYRTSYFCSSYFFFISIVQSSIRCNCLMSWHWRCRSLSCTDLMIGASMMFGNWSPCTCFCAHSACRYHLLELCVLLNVRHKFQLLWAQFLLVFLVLFFVSTWLRFVALYLNCQTDAQFVNYSRVRVNGSFPLSFSVNQAFDTWQNCFIVLLALTALLYFYQTMPLHRCYQVICNSQLSWSEVHLKKPSSFLKRHHWPCQNSWN